MDNVDVTKLCVVAHKKLFANGQEVGSSHFDKENDKLTINIYHDCNVNLYGQLICKNLDIKSDYSVEVGISSNFVVSTFSCNASVLNLSGNLQVRDSAFIDTDKLYVNSQTDFLQKSTCSLTLLNKYLLQTNSLHILSRAQVSLGEDTKESDNVFKAVELLEVKDLAILNIKGAGTLQSCIGKMKIFGEVTFDQSMITSRSCKLAGKLNVINGTEFNFAIGCMSGPKSKIVVDNSRLDAPILEGAGRLEFYSAQSNIDAINCRRGKLFIEKNSHLVVKNLVSCGVGVETGIKNSNLCLLEKAFLSGQVSFESLNVSGKSLELQEAIGYITDSKLYDFKEVKLNGRLDVKKSNIDSKSIRVLSGLEAISSLRMRDVEVKSQEFNVDVHHGDIVRLSLFTSSCYLTRQCV